MSAIKVTKYLSKILNVPELTTLLSGGSVYREVRPTNSEEKDIVINVNFLKDRYETGVNYGIANINIYSKALSNGLMDSAYFDSVYNKIIEIFEKRNYCYNSLTFNIEFTKTFQELLQNNWYYLNIRLNVQLN